MPRLSPPAYSYRADPAVPDFDDSKPLFLFDGVCVLCSTGVRWMMRVDREQKVNIAVAQSELGRALYAHYGRALDDSYILIENGVAWDKSEGYLRLAAILGGFWHVFRLARLVPAFIRNRVYDLVAKNRYGLFGKTGQCELLSEEARARLIGGTGREQGAA